MNTSKQVNIMIGTVLLAILVFGAYIGYEGTRQAHEREETTMRIAERGARLYIGNCRSCHGMEGEGHVGPALNKPGFRIIGEHDASGAAPTPQGEADAVNAFLINTISCGRTNTFMPLWAQRFGGSLSDTQVRQIATMITEGRWDLVKEEAAIHDAQTGDTTAIGVEVEVPNGASVLQACEAAGIEVPRFDLRDAPQKLNVGGLEVRLFEVLHGQQLQLHPHDEGGC